MRTDLKGNKSARNHFLDPHQWVAKYADYLYQYALMRIKDEDLGRELVQETFLAGLESKENFEGKSSEKTWLTAILKNKIVDIYRLRASAFQKSRVAFVPQKSDTDYFDHDNGHWDDAHSPVEFEIEQVDELSSRDFQRILQACMQRLPALWLSIFTMKHVDDESTKKICDELKVSPSNFWIIIHRTKVSLRSCLQKNWL